jgi:Tfp pilus assembly protein PilN
VTDPERDRARRRFWRNLIGVMTMQVVSLLLLWLLQRHYLV